jgi:hypothetical protein
LKSVEFVHEEKQPDSLFNPLHSCIRVPYLIPPTLKSGGRKAGLDTLCSEAGFMHPKKLLTKVQFNNLNVDVTIFKHKLSN